MANVFINALQLSIGGGKNILDNYIERLYENKLYHNYYILTPSYDDYKKYSKEKLIIIEIKDIFKINISLIFLYFYKYQRIINKYKIDLVFNFGDIIIPTKVAQIYFFDWPYAVYSAKNIWKGMSFKNLLIRKIKLFLVKRYINIVELTLCQTDNIYQRLKIQYKLKKLKIIPTPLSLSFTNINSNIEFNFPTGKKIFMYPSSFSSHKNFEIIISLGKLIMSQKLPFLIVITIDEVKAKNYLSIIKNQNIDCIYNTGKLSLNEISALYKKSDALLFPSFLETYGLPYLEAMFFEKPILTSNLDFAKAICGDLPFYFNPNNAESILFEMIHFTEDKSKLKEKLEKGKDRIKALPDWDAVFFEFEQQIKLILKENISQPNEK